MPREATDVHLVDDQVFNRRFQRMIRFPIEVVVNQPSAMLIDIVPIWLLAPYISATNRFGVWIEQYLATIKALPLPGDVGAVHPVAVFDILGIQVKDNHRIDVTDPKL